jgi:hypothetical protein
MRPVEKSASELAQLGRDARADQIDPTLVICRCAWVERSGKPLQ